MHMSFSKRENVMVVHFICISDTFWLSLIACKIIVKQI